VSVVKTNNGVHDDAGCCFEAFLRKMNVMLLRQRNEAECSHQRAIAANNKQTQTKHKQKQMHMCSE
jgi:hypothetical protein